MRNTFDKPRQVVMRERSGRLPFQLVCLAVLLGLALPTTGCGARSVSKVRDRGSFALELKPGQSLSLDSGITLTVPPGMLASGNDWGYDHKAPGTDGRSEYFIFASPTPDECNESTTTIVLSGASWYDGGARPDAEFITRTHVARSDDVDVHALVNGTRVRLLILLNRPGFERGYLVVTGEGTDPYAVLESFWGTWRVRPESVPPKAS